MKTLSKILIAGAIAGAITVGAPVAKSWWDNYRFARASPLAARLPSDVRQANDEFQRRIRDRFPIGTPQKELLDVLASQSFQPAPGNPVSMRLTIMGGLTTGLCRKDWAVFWQANKAGFLTQVDAFYGLICP